MNYAIRYGLMVIACSVLLAGVARAEENDASVSDGPSRAELFEARMRADLGANLGSLSASVTRPFVLPTDVLGDAIYGIDVSHYNDENCVCKAGQKCNQCKINWGQIPNQKVAFAYVKATQGTKYFDPTFQYHWRTLAQNRIPRGAYHFMSADEDPVDQADHFIDKLEDAGKLTIADLPPCLDLESDLRKDSAKKWIVVDNGEKLDFWKGQEPDEILGKVMKWLNRVEQRTGRIPIIYTSRGWWTDRIKDEKKFALLKRYPIWIANYPENGKPANDSPKVPNGQAWALWQFTEIGKMKDSDIVPGNLDVNVFRGTMVRFQQVLGVTIPTIDIARTDDSKNSDKPIQQAGEPNSSQPVDVNKPGQQVASISPAQATDASNPVQQAASANPNTPTETNKPADQTVVANPNQATDATKPVPQAASGNPAPPADANKSAQQIAPANTAQAPATAAPAQPAASPTPNEPTAANIVVAQQAAVPAPSQAPAVTAPVQAATTNPVPAAEASKAAAPAAAATAAPPADTNKPPVQTTASISPAEKKDAANPVNQPVSAPPAEPAQNTGTTNPKATSAARTPPSRRSSRTQKVAQEKSQTDEAGTEKAMVEIVLLNGRVLRVEANIDPGVLARLIAAVDN